MTDTSAVIDVVEETGALPDEAAAGSASAKATADRDDTSEDAQTTQDGQDQKDAESQADTADAADGAEPDEDDGESDSEPAKRRRPGKSARKIARLEAENQAFRERLARLEGSAFAKASADMPVEASAEAGRAPRREDFEDESDFIVARAKHEARRELQAEIEAQQRQQSQQAQQTAQSQVQQAWDAQVTQALDRHEDFEEVAYTAPISDQVAEQIRHMETGAEVAYFLGKHPDEARRISGLSLFGQARELGKIEARLESASKNPGKKTTNAPNPPSTVKGKGGPDKSTVSALDKMSFEEYRAQRMGSS